MSANYIKPFVFWDAGCKNVCRELYGPCETSGKFQAFKNSFHCVPDYFNRSAWIIEMKYSIDAFRRSLSQLERFRSVSDRICYWIYHDFPGKEAYEAKYGIRILSGSEVAALVSESGNAAAIGSFERMFRDETQVNRSDFWTKSAIDEYFQRRIRPFLPGGSIPPGKAYFRKEHAQWHLAVESLKKGYFWLEDFAFRNWEKLEGLTNDASEYGLRSKRYFPIMKFSSSKDQFTVVRQLELNIREIQDRFRLWPCLLFSARKQWSFGSRAQSIGYFAAFPTDLVSIDSLHRLYSEIVDVGFVDQGFASKAIHLTSADRPLFLETTADFDPKNHWFAAYVPARDCRTMPSADVVAPVSKFLSVLNVRGYGPLFWTNPSLSVPDLYR